MERSRGSARSLKRVKKPRIREGIMDDATLDIDNQNIEPPAPGAKAPCQIGGSEAQIIVNVFSGGEAYSFKSTENEIWCECRLFCCSLDHRLPFRVAVSQRAKNGSFVF